MKELTRRESLKTLIGSLGAAAKTSLFGAGVGASSGLLAQLAQAGVAQPGSIGGPKRVVFFLQNQGFDPRTCLPTKMAGNNGSLAGAVLPKPIQALDPFKDKLHIITGLHGKHTSPTHSAFFGALGGYRSGDGMLPSGSTIDHDLSQLMPTSLLPHLCIGMDSLEAMKAKPTVARLSASGAGKPIFMHSNPEHLYKHLYGGIATGDLRTQHDVQTALLGNIHQIAQGNAEALPSGDRERYNQFINGFEDMNTLRDKLASAEDHLRKFAPTVDSRYRAPESETDWHDVLLDLGISTLKSGTTNVLTMASGRGQIFGSYTGLGIQQRGHNLGHMQQYRNPIWDKIRAYNMEMLVKVIEELESVPEGSGTMMDNTLIVYTSNNADKQHTTGKTWPMMLIGNPGGAFKTGRLTKLDGSRPINSLYASLMTGCGKNTVERYNMSESLAGKFDASSGPLREVLA